MKPALQIAAVGDLAFNGGYDAIASTESAQKLFAPVRELFQSDLLIGNLEAVLIPKRPADPPWRFCMRGAPEYAQVLAAAGFKVLTLAANHTMDYGWTAVEQTLNLLRPLGIQAPGAGKNLAEARRPASLSINGTPVAVLAYCDIHVGIHLYATEKEPGVAPARLEWIVEDVRAARRAHDIVIVCLHWGDEYVHHPKPAQRAMARAIAAAGAQLVIGHHPHVLQGTERVGKALLAYSLGNFVFSNEIWQGKNRQGQPFAWPFRLTESARQSAVLKATVSEQGVEAAAFWPVRLQPDLTLAAAGNAPALIKKRSRGFAWGALYPLYWAVRFFPSRLRTQYRQNFSHRNWSKLRPHHLKGIWHVILHEVQQLRGAKE